jgi:broad specificity phosphatase PhoE
MKKLIMIKGLIVIVYLLRHGETDWNSEQRTQGNTDISLNVNGLNQARQAADYLSKFDIEAIYSSHLSRAYETASIIATKLQKPHFIDKELTEVNMGRWEGSRWDDIKIEYIDYLPKWLNNLENIPAPGGESYGQVQVRVVRAYKRIISKHSEDSNILIVSHGIAIKTLIAYILGLSLNNLGNFELLNASINTIEIKEKTRLISLNNICHL